MSRAAIDAMLPYLEGCFGISSVCTAWGGRRAGRCSARGRPWPSVLAVRLGHLPLPPAAARPTIRPSSPPPRLGERKGKKHIISTAFEHHAVLHTLQKLEKEGFTVETARCGLHRHPLRRQQVGGAIREDTCLVSVMYANNEIGSILPIARSVQSAASAGVLFHTDAVQAAGSSAHQRQRAEHRPAVPLGSQVPRPKGRRRAVRPHRAFSLTSLIEGGAQERGRRAGAENVPAVMGHGRRASKGQPAPALRTDAAKVSALRRPPDRRPVQDPPQRAQRRSLSTASPAT